MSTNSRNKMQPLFDQAPSPTDALANIAINPTSSSAHRCLDHIMTSLVRHLHEFAQEVNLTIKKFEVGIKLVGTSIPFLPPRLTAR